MLRAVHSQVQARQWHAEQDAVVVAVRVPAADGGRRTCPRFSGDAEMIRDISMSWWLSKPVQMNLREQLETPFDVTAACGNDAEVKAVWTALATPSRQCLAN